MDKAWTVSNVREKVRHQINGSIWTTAFCLLVECRCHKTTSMETLSAAHLASRICSYLLCRMWDISSPKQGNTTTNTVRVLDLWADLTTTNRRSRIKTVPWFLSSFHAKEATNEWCMSMTAKAVVWTEGNRITWWTWLTCRRVTLTLTAVREFLFTTVCLITTRRAATFCWALVNRPNQEAWNLSIPSRTVFKAWRRSHARSPCPRTLIAHRRISASSSQTEATV